MSRSAQANFLRFVPSIPASTQKSRNASFGRHATINAETLQPWGQRDAPDNGWHVDGEHSFDFSCTCGIETQAARPIGGET